jgi:hypothetical protein
MLEGKAVVEDTDMPAKMQAQAMSAASRALDRFDVLDCRSIASHIKKVTLVARAVPSPTYEPRLIGVGWVAVGV